MYLTLTCIFTTHNIAVFPLRQWLRERATTFRYSCIVFLVIIWLSTDCKDSCFVIFVRLFGFGLAQSVYRLGTGWTVRGSNPGGGKKFSLLQIRQDRFWRPLSLLPVFFFRRQSGRGVKFTTRLYLVLSGAVPLFDLTCLAVLLLLVFRRSQCYPQHLISNILDV